MEPDDNTTVRQLLELWEQREELDPTSAAARLGYSLRMYESIKSGERRPKLSRCLHFQESTGVPATLFYPEIRGLV